MGSHTHLWCRSPLAWFVVQVILMTFVLLLLVGFFVAIPVALIAVGATNLHNCPARNNIPIWMIVFGSVYLVQSGLDRIIAILRVGIEAEHRRRPEYEVSLSLPLDC
jgi:hypothetical protein